MSRQVENKVDIYNHGKLLRQHSIGQRVSALILFILTQDDNDIIFIDQPEDDLDNKVIYDEVITAIARKKPYMKFIFATHNANIPVLSDSERVLVDEFQETQIDVAQGNIDLASTHKQIFLAEAFFFGQIAFRFGFASTIGQIFCTFFFVFLHPRIDLLIRYLVCFYC